MEGYLRSKNLGVTKINQKKYNKAVEDFNNVIDSLTPQNEEETILKCNCLLNRSFCYTQLHKYTEAQEDANTVIKIYNDYHHKGKQNNPLTPILSLAHVRLGECYEAQLEYLEAFQEYSEGNRINKKGEAQKSFQSLLKKLNIPIIDPKDKQLQSFSQIINNFLNEKSLNESLESLINTLHNETKLEAAVITKINSTDSPNIIYGIIQLYHDNKTLINNSLIALRLLVESGVSSVWNGYIVIRNVMKRYESDLDIIGNSIKLLRMIPRNLYSHLSKEGFIPLITKSLKIINDHGEIEGAFFLLFQIASSPSLLVELINQEIIEIILEKKTMGALLLLSKLSLVPELLKQAETLGAIDWIFEMLKKENINEAEIIAASLIFSRILLRKISNEEKENRILKANKIFDALAPLLMKNTKNEEVVATTFAAFSIAVNYAPEKAKEFKLIRLASVLLAMHMKMEDVAQNLVAFLYEAANSGLLDDVKEVKPALPTVLKALSQYPSNEAIVERSVALAYLLDHPNKMDMLRAALMQFNNSNFLKVFIAQNGILSAQKK
ncbi:tetratricopeptide repeat protein [Histomonas meleagridis]|uniref:tetratricopeptide repeat protein n=1 Tax=Histomonas meleagridis TaxID=135588 RepID=UPI00355A1430|nr:tetratricopeptide repeat protein [Histomonas meleagridis]KAH0803409.1 tetratricopeptide repeat protein [Histomonas meleagridis]